MRPFHFNTTDSTSTRARDLIAQHPGQTLLVAATQQTQGRGRSGRTWHSPPGGAWFTLAHPTTRPHDTYKPAPLIAGLAIAQAIEQAVTLPTPLAIKWPNDLLLNNQKLAGILCEWLPDQNTLLIGVGINANIEQSQLNQDLHFPATSTLAATGQQLDIPNLIDHCANNITHQITQLESQPLSPQTHDQLNARLAWRNTQVRLEIAGKPITGTCLAIAPTGQLTLEINGQPQSFDTGQVTQLRPADTPKT